MTDDQQLLRADRVIWSMIALTTGMVLSACAFGSFRLVWASFAGVAIASLLLGVAGRFYLRRKDARPATALLCTAQFALFPAVAAPLSYVAASAGRPLWDETYAAWDRAFGLDWMSWLAAMNHHVDFHSVLAIAYTSFMPQAAIVIVALSLSGHLLRLRLYILSFILAALFTIAVSAVMPAQGVWGHLQLSLANSPSISPVTRELHLAVFHGLRDGSFRDLVAHGAEGIITFPSLHTAAGLLFIFAMWPNKYLRWPFVLLNVAMIASTPVDGGHYFSDVVAGTAVAILCWMAAARMLRAPMPAAELVSEIAVSPSIEPDMIPYAGEAAPSPHTNPKLQQQAVAQA
jgi:membrane-associated phospholipid phosphatase